MNHSYEEKKKIIIADDTPLNCEMLTDILGQSYEYVYLHDGESLLSLLYSGESADMILLDMNMPNLSGMEVLKVMGERHWTAEIPVVIISAEDDVGVIQQAYELGATAYIVRPFQAFLVKHTVENTLTQYSQKRQLARFAEKQIFEREKMNNILINIFGSIVELRNSESGEHTIHVQTITRMLLNRLVKVTDQYALSGEDIAMISTAAALHDIGKAMIPWNILNKPGKFTPEEWEIMKSHTTRGDEFLQKLHINRSEKFVVLARQICRYHHERYDGKGYPDGLVGEQIPISAQVVSMADVYDALTSDRCYKKAYAHEQAVRMIRGGECGQFNPVLLQCFTDIADDLLLYLNLNGEEESHQATALASEGISGQGIRLEERTAKLLAYETAKKEFFAEKSGGIQFEYDAVRRKVVYIKHYNSEGERVELSSESIRLLCDKDMDALMDGVSKMTRQNNVVTMDVLVPIDGDMRWHKLTVKSIWSKNGSRYKILIGQLTDIHEKMVRQNVNLTINEKTVDNNALLAMRNVFEVVRLVDPINREVIKVGDSGEVIRTGQKCYHFWGREEPCLHCSGTEILNTPNWVTKTEIKDGRGYSVACKYANCAGCDCALEVAICLDEQFKYDEQTIGYTSVDSAILQRYYHDTVTKTYSRNYLDMVFKKMENVQAVAMIDVDKFKVINDRYGHIIGDAVLRHVAKQIRSCVRKEDLLIRYGGDEFVLAFNEISKEDFFEKLQHIKQAVRCSMLEDYPDIAVTISIGGAYGVHPLERAIDLADKEMYKDKFSVRES